MIIITSNWIISKGYLEGPKKFSNVDAIDWELNLLGICIGKLSVTLTVTLTLSNFTIFKKTLVFPLCYQAEEKNESQDFFLVRVDVSTSEYAGQ